MTTSETEIQDVMGETAQNQGILTKLLKKNNC
jgi:hypothetical protein